MSRREFRADAKVSKWNGAPTGARMSRKPKLGLGKVAQWVGASLLLAFIIGRVM